MPIKDTDKGAKKLLKRLKLKSEILVGIMEPEASKKHGTSTVGEIAAKHEFGTEQIPQRSWLRDPLDARQNQTNQELQEAAKESLNIRRNAKKGFDEFGENLSEYIKAHLSTGKEPLDPETVEAKGSNKPLVDTGLMRNSIKYKVNQG